MQQSSDLHFLLQWARDIGRTFPFLDFHVHPFDVLTGDTQYQVNDNVIGLYFKGLPVYHPAQVQDFAESSPTPSSRPATPSSLLLASRLTYTHIGPKVLSDQLDAAGLAGALLLPVARTRGAAEHLLQVSARIFADEKRLFLACPFPIGIKLEALDSFLRSARETWEIRAIKLHPNLVGVDPLIEQGKELIESMLVTAGSLDLPVVIHGGRTPALEPVACREYGTLAHLTNVDWSISSSPVVIAHAGLCCLTEEESVTALDVLERLFERHPNLMADTSNLEPRILQFVLEKLDPSRLLFGSDALYIPIWKSWIRFLQVVRRVSQHPDDDLISIASLNPSRCIRLNSLSDPIKSDN